MYRSVVETAGVRNLQDQSKGYLLTAQTATGVNATRGFGLLTALDGAHVFARRPAYLAIAGLTLAQRLTQMRTPEIRRAILGETDDQKLPLDPAVAILAARIDQFYAVEEPLEYEPEASRRFGVLASAAGKTPEEYLYDYLVSGPIGAVAMCFALNYSNGDMAHVREMLQSPVTIAGLGDGGAHSRVICDASLPTFGLTFWARDRSRGPLMPIETMVRKQTSEPAHLYSLHDRGVLEVGRRADLNVIHFDRLRLYVPRIEHDLPANGARMIQSSSGYVATMVGVVVTRRNDQETGSRPGRLLRWTHSRALLPATLSFTEREREQELQCHRRKRHHH